MLCKVEKGQDPYTVIGNYISDHMKYLEDMIATISIDGKTTNELFMVDMDADGYFVWKSDWWEGEKNISLVDFFPVSDAKKPSAQPETFEWCHDCKEYDQEKHCCHRWSQRIRKTIEELEANYPQEIKDELLYWKERAAKMERDYIRITGSRKHVPNIDLEEVEEDEIN